MAMLKQSRVLVALLVFWSGALLCQSSSAQDFTFQVTSAQSWTDTGMDLQSGDVLQITQGSVTTSSTDPACGQKPTAEAPAQTGDLPLPSAPQGALIARLHAQGAIPLQVGTGTDPHIEESSHLFLGLNLASRPACGTNVTVKVHKTSAGSIAAAASARLRQPGKPRETAQVATLLRSADLHVGTIRFR
jgi:hypothetical protein